MRRRHAHPAGGSHNVLVVPRRRRDPIQLASLTRFRAPPGFRMSNRSPKMQMPPCISPRRRVSSAFRFFSREIKTQSVERLMLETSLRRALERDEFVLHYQAKQDLATGGNIGCTGSAAMAASRPGVLPPIQFISLGGGIRTNVPIGRWVLDTACAQNMAWQEQGLPPMRIAVNLSPRQFTDLICSKTFAMLWPTRHDAAVAGPRDHREHDDAERRRRQCGSSPLLRS